MGIGSKITTVEAFRELGDLNSYQAIVSYGIVNPFGPTLIILATPKVWKGKETVPIIMLQIHPLFPEIMKRWEISTAHDTFFRDFENVIEDICTGDVSDGGCPTLFFPGVGWSLDNCLDILARIVSNRDGSREVYETCKRFKGNAFDRVSFEVSNMMTKGSTERLSYGEALKFVRMQIEDKSFRSEISAFGTAYNGAINHMPFAPKLSYFDFISIFKSILLEIKD